jgi:L-lactate dehydrogenase
MSTTSRARRIAIVGSGMVGSTTAYALLLEGISAEIVLIDKNQSLAEGHADDLCDAQLYSRTARVFVGDFADCATADIIIITAGVNQALMGNSRINDITAASEIVKGIVDEIRRYDPCGIILVASNPLDVMTYAVGKWSGLPPNRVIGSGTSLDTSRLRRRLAQHFGIAPENVHAFIIGEHGDTQVPVLSSARIAGMSIEDFCRDQGLPYDESLFLAIANKTRTAGYAIQQAKGSTYYGIATALTRIVRAIWKDENTVLTVSRLVPPEFGLGDVCLSLPVTLGLEGAGRPLNLTLSPGERAALHHSADTLKQYIAGIESLAPQPAQS